MEALILVDVQQDFCPGGALPSPQGDEIIKVINKLTEVFDVVVASRDVHPEQTKHFDKWPPHCIKGTNGAAFHPDLNLMRVQKVFLKGTGNEDDGYSAFEATNEDLKSYLKQYDVSSLYVAGLTTEYCVLNTVRDSLKNGFKTYLIKNAVGAVEPGSDNEARALKEMEDQGTIFLEASALIK